MRKSNEILAAAISGFALLVLTACTDCNGTTGVPPPCGEVDSDGDGVNLCLDCDDTNPNIYPGAPEICDGKINDCNNKDAKPDQNVTDAPACALTKGVCAGAKQQCVGGKFAPCDKSVYTANNSDYEPIETKCDGKDNDCNGKVDDAPGCKCPAVGDTQDCYGSGVGLCGIIKMTCVPSGPAQTPYSDSKWSPCVSSNGILPSTAPKSETRCFLKGQNPPSVPGDPTMVFCEMACDQKDDDCDGTADEDFDPLNDPNNCGVCNAQATPANAVPACINGSKDRGPCNPGFFDVDGNRVNGCEATYCSPPTTPPTLCYAASGQALPAAQQPSAGGIFDPPRNTTNINAFSTFAAGGAVGPFDPGANALGSGQVGVMRHSNCGTDISGTVALGACVNLGVLGQTSPISVQQDATTDGGTPVNQFVMSSATNKNVPGFMAACSLINEPCATNANCCSFGAAPLSCDAISHRCK